MKIGLIENGADSFKNAFLTIEKLLVLHDNIGLEHNLKDAILSLNHGVEILLKYILSKKEEYLIYTDLEAYMKAKKIVLEKGGESTAFDVNPKLKTVTMHEAINRMKYLCNIEIPETLETSLTFLNKIRNNLMHYELSLTDDELNNLISKLQVGFDQCVVFFDSQIPELANVFDDARFEITQEQFELTMMDMQAERMQEERW